MSHIALNRKSTLRRWKQFSLRSLLLLVLVVAWVCWWLRPETLHLGYFPIGIGYRWVYSSNVGNPPDDVVFEVTGTEKVGDANSFVVLRTIGDHQLKFYVEVTRRGVFIHQVGEDRYEPAYQQFRFYTKQDDQWEWKGKIGDELSEYLCKNMGINEVSVPLGKWDAFMIYQGSQASLPAQERASARFWLAEGVGVVELSGKSQDKQDLFAPIEGHATFDWKLKEFSRP